MLKFDLINDFIKETRALSKAVSKLKFSKPVAFVYNPLDYASDSNEVYIRKYLKSEVQNIFLGMNPGPFGMAQTGVPFGDVVMVRDWLNLEADVRAPENQHPKRPIAGFNCPKREVSGSRLWGWARDRYIDPEKFFDVFFVWNYCPLVFMSESGANITPDKLAPDERLELFNLCDVTLRRLVELSNPKRVIGVGKFARKRAENAVSALVEIGDILHPSPASPKANRNWAGEIQNQLSSLGCF